MGQPQVSVIMPVLNGGHYIEQAILSIINQTYQNFEFLIIDDGSTDKSWQIIMGFQEKYPKKIKCFKLPKHIGTFAATNFAIKKSNGEFIALMDCDDIAYPTRFEKQVTYLVNNPDVIVVGSHVKIINEKGKVTGKKRLPTSYEKIYKAFGIFHPMVHPVCMVRKYLPNGKVYRYINKFGVNDDYNTFFSILRLGKFINLDEYLLSYRIHNNNHSIKNIRKIFLNSLKIRIEASKKYNYNYSLTDILLIFFQALFILVIPSKYIFSVYSFCRNIYYGTRFSRKPFQLALSSLFKLSRSYLSYLVSYLL